MQNAENTPPVKPPIGKQDKPQSDSEQLAAKRSELRKASDELKAKIAEAKRRNDMPVNSALGNPDWDQRAADGHLDVRDEDDDK